MIIDRKLKSRHWNENGSPHSGGSALDSTNFARRISKKSNDGTALNRRVIQTFESTMQICLINRKYYHTSQSTNRQLRCRKWIGIVVQQCSYTPATEAVLPSIHYARSVISRSGAALRRYRQTLFKKDMEPRGEFFLEIIRPNLPWQNIGEPLPWDSQRASTHVWSPHKRRPTTRHTKLVGRGGRKAFVREKGLAHTHTKRWEKLIFTNLKKNIRAHKVVNKSLRLYLTEW